MASLYMRGGFLGLPIFWLPLLDNKVLDVVVYAKDNTKGHAFNCSMVRGYELIYLSTSKICA